MDALKLDRGSDARGVSLAGLLMMIVVLGALGATAIVGVSSLTDDGTTRVLSTGPSTPADAARALQAKGASTGAVAPGGASSSSVRRLCMASADAARAASAIYFANSGVASYPVKWSDLTTSNPALYKPTTNVVINGANPKELDGRGWKLVVSGGGATAPTFTCS
jgi:hypothetical protein